MFLLSEHAEVRAMSANDSTCLIGACIGAEKERVKIVKEILRLCPFVRPLIARCPKMIDVQDVDGKSALHVAASTGNLDCVNCLLDAGADCTLRDIKGLTPLQEGAAARGDA